MTFQLFLTVQELYQNDPETSVPHAIELKQPLERPALAACETLGLIFPIVTARSAFEVAKNQLNRAAVF